MLWSSIWGLCGAILSVPLLGAMKIMLDEIDHPMAKIFLATIREDAGVDEEEQAREQIRNLSGWLQENQVEIKGQAAKSSASFESEPQSTSKGDSMDNPLANKTTNDDGAANAV